ncbi:MAG: PilN domain-containing protein [Myxococcota bacterium]
MIRINLLPTAKKATRVGSPTQTSSVPWGVGAFIGVLLCAVVMLGIYFYYGTELDAAQSRNTTLQNRITELEAQSAGLEELRSQLEDSNRLLELVDELNRAKLGPTRVLMELSRILSENGGPTIDPREYERIRRENPLAGYNQSWDPKRLWLTSFEEENRSCRIKGVGKTNDDVAEFLRRLILSDVFEGVSAPRTEEIVDQESQLTLIGFDLTCRVVY